MEQQVEQARVSLTTGHKLDFHLNPAEHKAVGWLFSDGEEPREDVTDPDEIEHIKRGHIFSVTITDKTQLEWLTFYAAQAEYHATTPALHTESPSAVDRRRQTMRVQYRCPRSQHLQIQNIDPQSGFQQNRCRRTTSLGTAIPHLQAAFDNGSGSCQGKTYSGLSSSWHEGRLQRTPAARYSGGFFLIPPSPGNTLQLPAP